MKNRYRHFRSITLISLKYRILYLLAKPRIAKSVRSEYDKQPDASGYASTLEVVIEPTINTYDC